ncbi:MAG: hypothetical protein ACPF9K_06390 [Neptuniibacter sp.]
MNSIKLFNTLLLGGILAVTAGCDSSYHSYDGNSGFKFEPLSIDTYVLEYQGTSKNSKQDVEVMWHHAAREICRGAGYQHAITGTETQKDSIETGNELIPKTTTRFRLEGEITCLAPNIALKRQEGKLFSDHLTTDNLISRSTTD